METSYYTELSSRLYIMDKLVQAAIYTLILWLIWSYWKIVIGPIQLVLDTSIEAINKSIARERRH